MYNDKRDASLASPSTFNIWRTLAIQAKEYTKFSWYQSKNDFIQIHCDDWLGWAGECFRFFFALNFVFTRMSRLFVTIIQAQFTASKLDIEFFE